jgi:hypothetical protein
MESTIVLAKASITEMTAVTLCFVGKNKIENTTTQN